MSTNPNSPPCPQCTLENTYHDGTLYICADCGFEWSPADTAAADEGGRIVRDSNGTVLQDGARTAPTPAGPEAPATAAPRQ